MAQLKLNLPEADVDDIRRLARESGFTISAYVRRCIYGEPQLTLEPQSIRRLDLVESQLAELQHVVSAMIDTGTMESFDRRLSRLEEMAER